MSGKKPAIWLFIALVLSAAIPVLLLGGWMAYITADQQRSYARRAATEALTQAAHRIESEIAREMQVANALANSIAIDHGNLNDFYQEAARLVADRPLWETAALTKPNREQVLNVLRPLGEPLEPVSDTDSFNAALRSRKPILGGLGVYQPVIGKRLVALRVPVIREGEIRYVLTIGLLPDQISTILGQTGLPAGWAGTVVDAKEQIVARTPDKELRARAPRPLPFRKLSPVVNPTHCTPGRMKASMSRPCTSSWRALKAGRCVWEFPYLSSTLRSRARCAY